jgi:uncharacterized protein (DUF433 family)
MNDKISIDRLEALLTGRPGYDMKDDCPHTEKIAAALESGDSPSEILLRFPHLKDCELCRESVGLYSQMADSREPSGNANAYSNRFARVLPRRILWSVAAALVVGICAGIGAVIWHGTGEANIDAVLTPKGAMFDLEIAVSRNGAAFPLRHGETVRTGDQLGFFYSASRNAHLALFHVDGTGKVSVLYPTDSSRTRSVLAGTRIPLKDGAIVTPATTCEWTVAIFTGKEMSVSTLGGHLADGLTISDDCTLTIDGMKEMQVKVQRIRN